MRILIKMAAVCAIMSALAGCATTGNLVSMGATVNPNYAYAAVNTFNAAETSADSYLKLPACTSSALGLCRQDAAVAQIVALIRSGRTARNSVVTALHASNGGAIDVNAYNTLQAIIGTLQSIYANYKIS